MSFEYMLMQQCPLKDEHGPDELIQLRKTANMTAMILHSVMQDDPDQDLSKIQISHETNTGRFKKSKPMSLQDMLPVLQMMEQLAPACDNCPANISRQVHGESEAVGCYATIKYPFTAWGDTFLDWIVRYLVQNYGPSKTYPFLFMSSILDFNTKGQTVTEMRQADGTFFERKDNPQYVCNNLEGHPVNFTLDTIWETLMEMPGDAHLYHMTYVPLFDLMEQLLPQAPPEVKSGFDSDITVQQLRLFGQAIRLAAQCGCQVGCIP